MNLVVKTTSYYDSWYHYKCRADNIFDIAYVISKVKDEDIHFSQNIIKPINDMDAEWEFRSPETYETWIKFLNKIAEDEEIHVIVETFKPINEYTGERD